LAIFVELMDGVGGDGEVGRWVVMNFWCRWWGFYYFFSFFFSGTGLTLWTEDHSSPVSESDPPPFLMERGVDRTPAYLGIFSSKRRNAIPSVLCDTSGEFVIRMDFLPYIL